MTFDNYDSGETFVRSSSPLLQIVKYREDELLPPLVSRDDVASAKGAPARSRKPHLPDSQAQACHCNSVLIDYSASGWHEKFEDEYSAEKMQVLDDLNRKHDGDEDGHKSVYEEGNPLRIGTIPPSPIPVSVKTNRVSFRSHPELPSIQAQDRRPIEDRPGLSPPNDSTKRSSGKIISLPSLHYSESPPSSCVATSPDSGSGNSRVLPPIRFALEGLSPSDFLRPRLSELPPLGSFPGPVSSRNESPRDRQFPQFLPPQVSPSPFSQLSSVSTKDASNNSSSALTVPFWLSSPPLPPPSEPTSYNIVPFTAKSPAAGSPTPTEQVDRVQGSRERASFSSQLSTNGVYITGCYKCTYPRCAAAPFKSQFFLR